MASSSHYPQLNGLVELMIKVSKDLIDKAILQGKLWYFLLQEQKTNPISVTIPSPAEILLMRKSRSNLSILPSHVMNDRISYIHDQIARKEGRILTEERNTVQELELEPGQAIWYQDPHSKKWNSGWIKEKLQEPHSHKNETEDGVNYRRNRNYIKPRQVPFTMQNEHSTGWSGKLPSLPKASALLPNKQHLWMPCLHRCILQYRNMILHKVKLEQQ